MYGTLAGANTYHTARINAEWTGTDAEKTAALVRGSDYVDQRYRWRLPSGRWQSMFPGTKAGARAQEREWPRVDATDYEDNEIAEDEVPVEVEYATYEAALRELAEPGSLSPDFVGSGQIIAASVDGAVSVKYSEAKTTDNMTPNRPVIPEIDEIIAPVVRRPWQLPAVVVV